MAAIRVRPRTQAQTIRQRRSPQQSESDERERRRGPFVDLSTARIPERERQQERRRPDRVQNTGQRRAGAQECVAQLRARRPAPVDQGSERDESERARRQHPQAVQLRPEQAQSGDQQQRGAPPDRPEAFAGGGEQCDEDKRHGLRAVLEQHGEPDDERAASRRTRRSAAAAAPGSAGARRRVRSPSAAAAAAGPSSRGDPPRDTCRSRTATARCATRPAGRRARPAEPAERVALEDLPPDLDVPVAVQVVDGST